MNRAKGRTEQGARPSATRRTNAYQSERCLAHATLQPPYIRENSPRMLLRSPLGLSRSLSTDPPPPFLFSRLGYIAWRIEVRAIYHRREKSTRHRPYPNSWDDFVRRLSTISPLFARRQEEAAAPISRRNEASATLLVPLPSLPLFRLESTVPKEHRKMVKNYQSDSYFTRYIVKGIYCKTFTKYI